MENLIREFIANQEEKKFVEAMELLETLKVFVPAVPPDNMSQPQPFLLKKNDGAAVLPIFSSKEQIPEEKRSPLLLYLPFEVCVSMVLNNQDKVQEIVLNPFTQGLTIRKPAIEVAQRRIQGRNGQVAQAVGQTIQMTKKEFEWRLNRQAALVVFPTFFLTNKLEAMEQLQKEKEKLFYDQYVALYPEGTICEYGEDDFSILSMNVSDTLQVVRVDLPKIAPQPKGVIRVYLAVVGGQEIRYYAVLQGEQNGQIDIVRVHEDKHQEEVLKLEDYGSEITEIMELAVK